MKNTAGTAEAINFINQHIDDDQLAIMVVPSGQGNVPEYAWQGTGLPANDDSLYELAEYYPRSEITPERIVEQVEPDTRNISTHLLVGAVQRALLKQFFEKTGIKSEQIGLWGPHSLGLLNALLASGRFDLEQMGRGGVKRAEALDVAAILNPSGLIAVLNAANLEDAVKSAQESGIPIDIALDNHLAQQVIATERATFETIIEFLKESHGLKFNKRGKHVPMNAPVGFHSRFAKSTHKHEGFIQQAKASGNESGSGLLISNVTGGVVEDVPQEILDQMISRVQFRQGIEFAGRLGVAHFVVIGLQNSLAGAIKQILGKENVTVYPITNVDDVEKVSQEIDVSQIPTFGQVKRRLLKAA